MRMRIFNNFCYKLFIVNYRIYKIVLKNIRLWGNVGEENGVNIVFLSYGVTIQNAPLTMVSFLNKTKITSFRFLFKIKKSIKIFLFEKFVKEIKLLL